MYHHQKMYHAVATALGIVNEIISCYMPQLFLLENTKLIRKTIMIQGKYQTKLCIL